MHWAAFQASVEMVQGLVARGCEIDAKDEVRMNGVLESM